MYPRPCMASSSCVTGFRRIWKADVSIKLWKSNRHADTYRENDQDSSPCQGSMRLRNDCRSDAVLGRENRMDNLADLVFNDNFLSAHGDL